MSKHKYLLLAIIPLFVLGFLTLALLRTDPPISIQKSAAQGNAVVAPQPVSLVTAPTPSPVTEAQPDQPVKTVATKPATKTPAPQVKASGTTVTPTPRPSPVSCSGSFTTQFICLLNQYRASNGKGSLSYSNTLSAVALAHSVWMNTTGTFAHVETNGTHMNDRCLAAGITCRAENLAEGATSAQNLLDLWKASGSHNANLLGPYTIIGIGISGPYITADFN